MTNKLKTTLDTFIPLVMEKFQIPGCAVAVTQRGKTLFMEGYGVQKMGSTQPVTPETLFALASISKSTTTACLAKLVEEERIHWDDPVQNYLPDFKLADPFASQEITIRDLVRHNCGLPEVSGGTIWYGSTLDQAEVIQRLQYLQPASRFREKFAYQNVTFVVAGEIIHQVSGLSWEAYFKKHFLTPLEMTRTVTNQQDLSSLDKISTPHARLGSTIQPIAHRSHDNIGPAASVYASIQDWIQYIHVFLNSGQRNKKSILSTESIREIWRLQTPMPVDPYPTGSALADPMFMGYGLGWFIQDYRGSRLVWHSGGVDGFRTIMMLIPDQELAVLVFTNMEASYATKTIAYTIIDMVLKKSPIDWLEAYYDKCLDLRKEIKEKYNRNLPNKLSSTAAIPKELIGTYYNPLCGRIRILNDKDHQPEIRFDEKPAFTGKLHPTKENQAIVDWDDPYIPNGLINFSNHNYGEGICFTFDQPNLLDVDFSELGPIHKIKTN